jgi:IS5 family transposase
VIRQWYERRRSHRHAAKPADFANVIADTTVQPKAVAFPTDAKLMHRA